MRIGLSRRAVDADTRRGLRRISHGLVRVGRSRSRGEAKRSGHGTREVRITSKGAVFPRRPGRG